MKQDQSLTALQSFPLFQDLSEEELERIYPIAILRSYHKKSVIFHEGADKEAIYFICNGLVKTYKTDANGHENIVSFLKEGDMFPHTAFFDPHPYPATAETLVDSTLIAIPLGAFEQTILSIPALAVNIFKLMGEKIRELQETIQHITGKDVHNRFISFLLKLADRYGEEKDGMITIPMPMTNLELANAIGTTRETINRLLNQLRKERVIRMKTHELIIVDYEALSQMNQSP
ncbi:CRP-like cAMP-activated global transcriptional regulator [Paenibacillus sp. CECT 9249]|uniref:Crp/Fnr family transcriptional regulator n=1 Tax=Paenibacillus sp. CECT 9249 TaxID=2845385 RepID=UPI001E504DBE|nr:Crp/Fnr family transcriptional regulator [Paenibacillus sp. CECT 9249]CAH0119922.1 CRP-like cAMP-activated global transcriptional regulator [Paenibacillus sp. CECT 9249]